MAAVTNIDALSSWMIGAFDATGDEHHGPMQFLQKTLGSDAEQAAFINFLDKITPDSDNVWSLKDGVPGDNALFFANPQRLCYQSVATTKPPPEVKASRLICQDILKNTFVSQDNPLLVWIPEAQRTHSSFSLCFVKGMARACTLLAMLKLSASAELDLLVACPSLVGSVKQIHCRMHYSGVGDRKKVAFMNAALSARLSICEKHSVLTRVAKIKKLREGDGLPVEASTLISEWNKEATADSALSGQKRVGVLNLLSNCDNDVIDILVAHHSKMGSGHFTFTDECFANKNCFLGINSAALAGAQPGPSACGSRRRASACSSSTWCCSRRLGRRTSGPRPVSLSSRTWPKFALW